MFRPLSELVKKLDFADVRTFTPAQGKEPPKEIKETTTTSKPLTREPTWNLPGTNKNRKTSAEEAQFEK